MGTPIVFSQSDIDEQATAAIARAVPKPVPASTPMSSHVTFSPSDIDENATAAMAATSSAQPTQQSTGANIWAGVKQSAPAQILTAAVTPPESAEEHIASLAGPGALIAYRQAKGVMASIKGAMSSSGTKFVQAVQDVKSAADQFHRGDYRNAASSAVSAATDAAGLLDPMTSGISSGVRELSEGARPGGNLATPLTRQLIDAGTAVVGGELGSEAIGGDVAGDEAAASESTAPIATPKAQAVAQGVSKAAKAGVSEGTAETVAPTGETIQPQLHAGLRNFVNQTLDDAGLDAVPDSVPITDAPQKLADAFQARSQDIFNKVEELTGVNPTTLKEQMAARADQITEAAASGEVEKAGKLEMLQKADENKSLQAFNQAKAQGVDVDQARSDWNASIRGDELSAAVRGSKANTSTLKNPILDPGKLAPRLQKLAESQPGGKASKLSQLGGDRATGLVEHAENARDATQAIKDFVPQGASGQKLFSQILSNNTVEKGSLLGRGKVVGQTDWGGVVKDLGNLSPAQQSALGDDLARMRQFAGKQAVRQTAAKLLKAGVGLGTAEEVTRRGLNALSGH
jgi:hypothetical protein